MIVHILPGDIAHISLPLVKSISKKSKHKSFFLIPVFNNLNKAKYLNELSDISPSDYLLFNIDSHTFLSKIIMYLLGHRGEKLLQEAAIASVLYKYRKNKIVSHFYFKAYALLPFFKSYAWVCWGNIPRIEANASKLNKIKFKLYAQVIYRRCKNIVTLMNSDKTELIKEFNCKESHITVIPYIPGFIKSFNNQIQDKTDKGDKVKLLLGNSTYSIKDNIKILPLLSNYNKSSELYALMSYGDAPGDLKNQFLENANRIFMKSFFSITELIPREEYTQWLAQFDIYICNVPSQTGLGVIYRMLYLGKKVFLTGHNYNWCHENELIVFPIETLIDGKAINLYSLSPEEKEYNKKALLRILDVKALITKWDTFYSSL